MRARKRKTQPERRVGKAGAKGTLHVSADVDGERVEGQGDYCYVGELVNGMHAFVPVGQDEPIYLHRHEVLGFKEGS